MEEATTTQRTPLPADEPILDELQAAAMLRVERGTLEGWRKKNNGPPYYRVSRNVVLYSRSRILQWLESRLVEDVRLDPMKPKNPSPEAEINRGGADE